MRCAYLPFLAPALATASVLLPPLSPARLHPNFDLTGISFDYPVPKFLDFKVGALSFSLQIKPHKNVCQERNVELNYASLSDNSGQTTIPLKSFSELWGQKITEHNLTGSWSYECLYDIYDENRAQKEPQPIAEALLFQFHSIDGEEIFDTDSGFTVSFTQDPEAKVIRFDRRRWPSGSFTRNEWSDLSRFTIPKPKGLGPPIFVPLLPPAPKDVPSPPLKGGMSFGTEKDIPPPPKDAPPPPPKEISPPPSAPSLKEQIADLKKAISECKTMKCAAKIMMEKAKGAAKMICTKFKPPHRLSHRPNPDGPPPHKGPVGQFIWKWTHGGAPKAASTHGPASGHLPSPHPFRNHRHRVAIGILSLTILFLVLSTVIYFAHRLFASCCCGTCSSTSRARRLAARRADRESRRTARAYRRAACREAWRAWWRQRNPFRRCSQPETQEKSRLVQTQEEVLEEAMQSEIQSLMAATDMVSEMVRAEEGRARPIAINNPPGLRRTLGASLSEVSLPSYRTEESEEEPPEYEEDEEGGVADGFRYSPTRGGVGVEVREGLQEGFRYDLSRARAMYTPSATTWTPESSVVGSPKSEF